MDYKTKTNLILPFKGTWMVMNGGRSPETNNHMNLDGSGPVNQRYAYDFCSIYVKNEGKNLEDYESFGTDIIAPSDGIVVKVIKDRKDMSVGERDEVGASGNMLIIDHGNSEYSYIAHFKERSIKLEVGDRVKRGEVIGLCGNSGNTSEPHIHYHLQDSDLIEGANGIPAQFRKIMVDAEVKENYEPTRGQKVSNI